MPLLLAKPEETLIIRRVHGNDAIHARLHALGFVEGEEIRIVQKTAKSLIVKVKDARIALDKTMAARIDVQ